MGDADTPAPDATPARGVSARRVLRWVGGALLALVLLVMAVFIVLQSNAGRQFAARQISDMTFANGLRIEVGRVEGSLYGKTRLIDVVAYDTKGRFMGAPVVELDWRPLAYLGNHIDIRSISAATVTLERVPQFNVNTTKGPLLPDFDIDVGALRIDHLIALPAVSGERRELRLSGKARIADRRAQVTALAETLAAPGGQGGDRLDLVLDAVPEAGRLRLKLALDAPQGGVFAALAGLDQSLALKIDGGGDWAKWDGTLGADLGGKPMAQLALSARDGAFAVKGPAELGRVLGGVPAVLLDATTQLDLAAKLDNRRAAVTGSLKSAGLSLIPGGTIDLASNSFDGFKLDVLLLRPAALATNLSGRALRAQLELNGAFARPVVQYHLTAGALATSDIVLEGIDATGKARVDVDQIVIPVSARVARIRGLDSVAGGTLTNVRLNGDLAVEGTRILSDNMLIKSDRIDAKAVLLADTAKGLYTGAFEGRINNYRIDSVGVFAVQTTADIKHTGQGLSLTGTVRARSTQLFNANVRDLLGGNAVGSSQLVYGPDGVIRFSRLRVSAPELQIFDGRGSYSSGGGIAITATGHSVRYGPLAIQLTGTLTKPRAVLLAKSPGYGIGLAGVRAEIIGSGGGYRFNATGQTDYGPLSADVTLLQGKALTLQINKGDLAGIGFSGRIQRSAAGPFTGQLDATGRGLGGVIRLGTAGRYQEALINVRANNTVLPGPAQLSIGSAIVDARVVLYPKPWVVADVQLAQTRIRGFDFTVARAQIDYRDGRGQAKFVAEGVSGVPFKLAGNAQLEPNLWRAALDGRVRGIAFRTASPARIIPSRQGYELLPTRFDFGQGSLRLAGKYGAGLKIESRMDRLDMALLNAFLPGYGIGGKATGSLDFDQPSPGAFPRADARLTIDGFSRTTAAQVSQPVDINFVGKLLADGGEGRAVIRQRGAVIGRLVASLSPLGPGAGSWVNRVAAAPLGGGIRYNGPADTLWSFVGQAGQTLAGPIAVGADFTGRLRQPQLTGIVRGENLTYENQTYGTRLTGMALSGHFAGNRLQVEQLNATAGSGKISGQGYLGLAAAEGYPMDMSFDLSNARLARSDTLSSAATGQLRLRKSAGENALLSGKLFLPETRYELVRQGASEVPELTGVRFKPPRGRLRITGNEPAIPRGSLLDGLRLDIALTAPNQLYVTGMGLDSEWRADLHVTGTVYDKRVSGSIDLVRGNLGFAGRQFELQEGRLIFTGGILSDPQIALSATEQIDDIAVTINVTGRALNPQIAFTSSPSLPADEVLARILFGNSVGQLSPIQAIQLAASLNSLRGTGGGLNPLGKLRAATGISRLRILSPDEASGRGTAIAAGRYISNNVYLEVITDARGFTATRIEVSLSQALSILSEAGGSGVTNFNVRYRKRY
ncbi:MAG: translocation/assembly module TamB domain-containing protein [Pseudomonadota bacterium]|nr:translocation/assembly module TamB domain-containing protein [Pseudomonadota bacterium]